MYTILADGKTVYAPNLSGFNYSVTNATINYELNRAGSLSFTLPVTNLMYNQLQKLKTVITVEQDGEEIWRGRILNDEKDFYLNKLIYCEGELAFLNDTAIAPYDWTNGVYVGDLFNSFMNQYAANCSQYRQILPGNITAVDQYTTIYSYSEDYTNTLDIILDQFVGYFGGYLSIRSSGEKRYLDWLANLEHTSIQTIQFGVNLIDMDEYIDASEVYTYMIPLGKKDTETGVRVDITSVNGGKNYISSPTGEDLFGKITKAVIFDEVTDPATLKSYGETTLSAAIELAVTITIRALDLHLLYVDTESLSVGDWVHVISLPHGIDTDFLCSAVAIDLINPENSEYIFGLILSALTDQQVSTEKLAKTASSMAALTTDEYNALRNEMQQNYITKDAFDTFKDSVTEALTQISDDIADLDKRVTALEEANK